MLPVTWVCDPRKGFNPLCLFSLLCTLTPTGFFLPSPFRATFGQLPLMLTTLMLPLCLLLGDPVATNCPENSWDQTVTFINLSKVRTQKITQRLLYDLKNPWACHRLPQCRKRLHHPPAPRHLVTPQIEFRPKWTSEDALSSSPTYLRMIDMYSFCREKSSHSKAVWAPWLRRDDCNGQQSSKSKTFLSRWPHSLMMPYIRMWLWDTPTNF